LNDDKSNVVLWPTWLTGSSKQLIPLTGPDGYVDPTHFFVILVDALGNGISSSPSNSSVQPRMNFPVFTVRDMVNWLRQLQALMAHNIASPFGDSLEEAARQVKAKLMVVVATQDHMSNPSPAMEFAGILHAPMVQLTGECGHLETGCDKAVAAPKVREFIGQ